MVFGDKAKLFDAVRLGYPIRIGWGSMGVEHVADADFLTIYEGKFLRKSIRSWVKILLLKTIRQELDFDLRIIGQKLQAQMATLLV